MPVDVTSNPRGSSQKEQLPLRTWALDLARSWNSGVHNLFIVHGNIHDIFPFKTDSGLQYVPLKTFLARRFFPDRAVLIFYDIGDGLTFGSPDMQRQFYEWLQVIDQVDKTNWHAQGPPRDFVLLAPLLRRFFLSLTRASGSATGLTLLIDFPEKIVPATEEAGASRDERMALVTLMKWAASLELRRQDIGILLITESAAELHADLVQNPHVAQVKIELPELEERQQFLESLWTDPADVVPPLSALSEFPVNELAARCSGLSLLRIQQLIAETRHSQSRLDAHRMSGSKKRLIEEYCQGLVRFKEPKPGLGLDRVATHDAAKQKLKEIVWLIQHNKGHVLERGILLPGRVGVGKSFLIDCFASECRLPVVEIGDFRSKWVGDTERQQTRILMTIRALGPVIVVVDEADAVFGTRQSTGDSGVSSRVFAAFAAHIGDSSLRGRELWIALTSRPDLLAIDMKRQGRFGLCIPLFPAQGPEHVLDLFSVIAKARRIHLDPESVQLISTALGNRPLTGSDVEAILVRAAERAVLAGRDDAVHREDLAEAIDSFIDPLDPELLLLQELAAVLACSDRRFLPDQYRAADRTELQHKFASLKGR